MGIVIGLCPIPSYTVAPLRNFFACYIQIQFRLCVGKSFAAVSLSQIVIQCSFGELMTQL